MTILIGEDWEELMQMEYENRTVADSNVLEWQKGIDIGDLVVSDPGYGFLIFHEILDKYDEPEMENYRFTNSFSETSPDGELGDIHISIALRKMNRENFNEFKARGFKRTKK